MIAGHAAIAEISPKTMLVNQNHPLVSAQGNKGALLISLASSVTL